MLVVSSNIKINGKPDKIMNGYNHLFFINIKRSTTQYNKYNDLRYNGCRIYNKKYGYFYSFSFNDRIFLFTDTFICGMRNANYEWFIDKRVEKEFKSHVFPDFTTVEIESTFERFDTLEQRKELEKEIIKS